MSKYDEVHRSFKPILEEKKKQGEYLRQVRKEILRKELGLPVKEENIHAK